MIFGGHLSKSPAQRLNTKAQLSLSPKLSSKLSPKAQVRLSSVGHYIILFLNPIYFKDLRINLALPQSKVAEVMSVHGTHSDTALLCSQT